MRSRCLTSAGTEREYFRVFREGSGAILETDDQLSINDDDEARCDSKVSRGLWSQGETYLGRENIRTQL